MNALYEKLRNEKSIARCLLYCLEYTNENPKDIGIVGAAWIEDSEIFLHTDTFAEFASKKKGTVNRYLSDHFFICSRLSKKEQSLIINHFSIQPGFVGIGTKRTSIFFNRYNAAIVVDNLPYKNSKKNVIRQTPINNGNNQNLNNNKIDVQSESDFSPPFDTINYDDEQTAFCDECYPICGDNCYPF